MRRLRRMVKNFLFSYSEAELMVREATCNDSCSPPSSLMLEIANLTFNIVEFSKVMGMLWQRLNDRGENWRHVYKALNLLDYMLKTGSDRVAQQCCEKAVHIFKLFDFQYIDSHGRDIGFYVRERARELDKEWLFQDRWRIQKQRKRDLKIKAQMAAAGSGVGGAVCLSSVNSSFSSPRAASDLEQARPKTYNEEVQQIPLALALSREEREKSNAVAKQTSPLGKEQDERRTESQTGTQRSAMMELMDIFGPLQGPPQPSDPWDSVAVHCSIPVMGSPWTVPS